MSFSFIKNMFVWDIRDDVPYNSLPRVCPKSRSLSNKHYSSEVGVKYDVGYVCLGLAENIILNYTWGGGGEPFFLGDLFASRVYVTDLLWRLICIFLATLTLVIIKCVQHMSNLALLDRSSGRVFL